ncbi:MAG: 1-deoxy-D-xylulose-5-phosphate synthase N-terminal domain-containing protein, partial [Desulfobaccales bacterium]
MGHFPPSRADQRVGGAFRVGPVRSRRLPHRASTGKPENKEEITAIPDHHHLKEISRQIRLDIIEMLYRAGSGHLGGSLSATDILVALFFSEMRVNAGDPCRIDRDRFILSKGHGAPAYYAVLARLGYFPREELFTLRQFGSILQGHPDSGCTPGVEIPTGSLGQGLSIANGLALAARLNGHSGR